MVEDIWLSGTGRVSYNRVLNVLREQRGSTAASSENLLRQWCRDFWLAVDDSHASVMVGVRGLAELRTYFERRHQQVASACERCQDNQNKV